MENVITNGFCELNEQEMMMVDGGGFISTVSGVASAVIAGPTLASAVISCAGLPSVTTAATVATCAASGPVGWVLIGGAALIGLASAAVGYASYCSVESLER